MIGTADQIEEILNRLYTIEEMLKELPQNIVAEFSLEQQIQKAEQDKLGLNILRPGKYVGNRWNVYEFQCDNCQCMFQYMPAAITVEKKKSGHTFYTVNCPSCGSKSYGIQTHYGDSTTQNFKQIITE